MSEEALNLDNLPEFAQDAADENIENINSEDAVNEPEKASNEEGVANADGDSNEYEESVVELFNKSLVEMVEKETYDSEALREAFIKALG